MQSSALSEKMRNNILVSDLVRIMRCVSPLCDPAERTTHVQHFIHRMQLSDYSQNQRAIVYKAAKKRYNQQLKNHNDGVTPLYRPKQWQAKQRCANKMLKKRNWCSEATYFVQATPGSQLAKQCQNVFRQCNLDICVIERPGKTIKQIMTKSNPFNGPACKCEVTVSNKPICRVCTRFHAACVLVFATSEKQADQCTSATVSTCRCSTEGLQVRLSSSMQPRSTKNHTGR